MTSGEKTELAPSGGATKGKADYRNITVALDGSNEAEAILVHVESIARAFNSRVTFVCALVPMKETPTGRMALSEGDIAPGFLESVYETREALGTDDASYLATLTKSWTRRGFDVACEEPQMRAADAIIQVARKKDADLIALTTHGRSGIRRTVLGSVADEVVRSAPCPVLIVRPE